MIKHIDDDTSEPNVSLLDLEPGLSAYTLDDNIPEVFSNARKLEDKCLPKFLLPDKWVPIEIIAWIITWIFAIIFPILLYLSFLSFIYLKAASTNKFS